MAASSPLLSLFKGHLETECAALAKKYELTHRGSSLIYWYFIRLHDFNESEVVEVLCDGANDLAIDAIWIDDDDFVHFYQFKHPEDASRGIPAGDVDKMISGLSLILSRRHDQIANQELKGRLEEVYLQVRNGYRIHIITSGEGVPYESKIKLGAFVEELGSPTASIVQWDQQALAQLQDEFYRQSLPAVKEPLQLAVPDVPYARRSGAAECYMFSLPGNVLAKLYKEHGEALLQRNIRVDQRDTATNRSIELTCSGDESKNFLHFNNGVTFLCEAARYDPFQHLIIIEKGQVVNGGQTIRALHRAYEKHSLEPDVEVPARAITAAADKDFANNVAVNQNNQNQIGTGFLRSNDKVVVQLDHALAALGWFLERREGELKTATNAERAAIEARIGHSLDGRVIRLKEGAQAYTATFFGQPEVAKKNVKKIFLSTEDGVFMKKSSQRK